MLGQDWGCINIQKKISNKQNTLQKYKYSAMNFIYFSSRSKGNSVESFVSSASILKGKSFIRFSYLNVRTHYIKWSVESESKKM